MKRLAPILLLLLASALTGCGYGLASKGPTRVPAERRAIAIAEVENPTFFTWMESRIQSLVRDEFTRRGLTEWVDRKQAKALLYVTVNRYIRSDTITGAKDQTLRYRASITLSARLVSAADGQVLWDSGNVSAGEYYSKGEEAEVDALVTELAVRQLADRLSQNY